MAKDMDVRVLSYPTELQHRRIVFLRFIDEVARVIQTQRSLHHVLEDFPDINQPAHASANKALYRFVVQKCHPELRELLDIHRREIDDEDGVAALTMLFEMCIPPDKDEMFRAQQQFVNTRIGNQESLQQYNKRYNSLYKQARVSRVKITPEDQVDQYLRGLSAVADTRLLVQLENYKSQRIKEDVEGIETTLELTKIQRMLQRSHELTMADIAVSGAWTMVNSRRNRSAPRTRAAANSTSATSPYGQRTSNRGRTPTRNNDGQQNQRSRSQSRGRSQSQGRQGDHNRRQPETSNSSGSARRFPGRCDGCGLYGHMVIDCCTTSAGDRQRLYDIRRSQNERRTRFQSPPATSAAPVNHVAAAANNTRTNSTAAAPSNPDTSRPSALRTSNRGNAHANSTATVPGSLPGGRIARVNNVTATRRQAYANNVVVSNTVSYEDGVILDSGASHHMTPHYQALTHIHPDYSQVMMPDGATMDCDECGALRLSVFCIKHQDYFVIPLVDTL